MKSQTITSRDNAQAKAIKKLAQTSASYKDAGLVWLEDEHLCDASDRFTNNLRDYFGLVVRA